MIVFTEGNLEITINHEIDARRFDGPDHRLSHCMRAVDFVVELNDCYQFIEIKDPQNPGAPAGTDVQYAQMLLSGSITEDLRYKYRDSFLYEWASGRAEKPVDYLVLVALDLLSEPELSIANDMLERNVPLHGPGSTPWERPIVRNCGVFNIASWNRSFPDYPVRRLPYPALPRVAWWVILAASIEPRSQDMQFGLFMMPLHPPHRSYADSYDRDLDLLQEADRLGFHEAWIGEHLTERWENAPFPDLLIAKASAMTENIRLATGVTLLPIHNPIELAHRIAMLDHLTRGRLYWGIGHRAIPTDLQLFGMDPSQGDDVRRRAAEVLDVVLSLWASEGQFSYHGEFFDIEAPELDPVLERGLHMKPLQQPHPPIGVAATSIGSSSIRVAGREGYIPMSSSNLAPRYLADHWTTVEDAAAEAGREARRSDWRIGRDVFVGETSEEARERAYAVLGRNYLQHQLPNRLGSGLIQATKIDPNMSDDDLTVEYMMDNIWIVGDPDECAQRIRALYDEVGGFGHMLCITQDPDDHQWEMDCLRLIAEEVAPRVSDLTG